MALSEKMGMLFHVVIGIFYCVSTYLDLQITTPGALLYGGRWKYLTFLNLVSSGFKFQFCNNHAISFPILNLFRSAMILKIADRKTNFAILSLIFIINIPFLRLYENNLSICKYLI